MSKAMMDKQRKLFAKLDKEFYKTKEIMDTLGMSYAEVYEITQKLTRDREKGFKKLDIILAIMGGTLYQTK